jgi:hypothetical protein
MNRYDNWITLHVSKAYGACAEVTLSMQECFPELTRVRGHYYCIVWGGANSLVAKGLARTYR